MEIKSSLFRGVEKEPPYQDKPNAKAQRVALRFRSNSLNHILSMRFAGFNHTLHDDMKHSIKHSGIAHGLPPLKFHEAILISRFFVG